MTHTHSTLSDTVSRWAAEAASVAILTGAGMSAESGIPTFRDAESGLWSQFEPEIPATPNAYRRDPDLVWGWYVWRMAKVRAAQPHPGHTALARLQAIKPGVSLVTQNVDDLHERAGARDVVHLHGSLFAPRCASCARPHADFTIPAGADENPLLRREPPRCGHCGGPVRPGVVWFGEPMPADAWNEAVSRVMRCALLLVIGTSGLVHPAASLPDLARRRGARIVEINPSPTSLSAHEVLMWQATAAAALPALLSAFERPT